MIFVTGNVGSGKSTLLQYLATHGHQILDLDPFAKSQFMTFCKNEYYPDYSDVALLKRLREITFDAQFKEEKDIVYSAFYAATHSKFTEYLSQHKNAIIEASTFYEVGFLTQYATSVLFVDADFDIRMTRLRIRYPNEVDSQILQRVNAQFPPCMKRHLADYVVANHTNDLSNFHAVISFLEEIAIPKGQLNAHRRAK